MLSPVSGEPQYQLKSPGHIAKMQLARAAAAQQAHRRSIAPTPPSSSESKAVQAVSRRRAAAEWVESLTGIALPTASDAALRGALRDGILLCKLLNILRPGILPKVRKQLPLDCMSDLQGGRQLGGREITTGILFRRLFLCTAHTQRQVTDA